MQVCAETVTFTKFSQHKEILLAIGNNDIFVYAERHGDIFLRVRLRGAKAKMKVLAVTSKLVITEDWGITRLNNSRTSLPVCQGQGGNLCKICLLVTRDQTNMERHMLTHI